MLLSYIEICELIERNIISGAKYENVNSSSLDITLGSTILRENTGTSISLQNKESLHMEKEHLPYALIPGEFVLASSKEVFNLPNMISAEYKLKSSMARIGLEHLNAGWCDAGWHGSVLTLELKNMTRFHHLLLSEGDKIGQIVFFRHTEVPADKSYAVRGRYNNDLQAQGAKR